jgi:hypothetical protein
MTVGMPVRHGQPEVYRTIVPSLLPSVPGQLHRVGRAMRPPIYVPNLVDNLWEWLRPSEFPNRRSSVFASPSKQLAQQEGPDHGMVCRVNLSGDYKMCQLKGYSNSNKHPECVALPIFLYERLGEDWINDAMERKSDAGRLWLPCVRKEEVDRLFAEVETLRGLRAELSDRIRYWSDVVLVDPQFPCLDPEGEVFFTTSEGYYLTPICDDLEPATPGGSG